MKKTVLWLVLLCGLSFSAQRSMTIQDLWDMKRIGDVALSPDGRFLVYVLTAYNMDKNNGNADLWIMPAAGGPARQLTLAEKFDGAPHWYPDGSGIAFISSRSGSRQIYFLSMQGGEAVQLTHLPVDVDDFTITPDGKHFAFTASVYADAKDLQESGNRMQARSDSKVKAYTSDRLMFRVFDHWTDGLRSHLFICDTNGQNVIDLTPGDYDTPPADLGGTYDYAFAPAGTEYAFVRNIDPVVAVSTNNDIFVGNINGTGAKNLTATNKANDNQPIYSPDGNYLAYKAMQRPGFEADQYDLILYDRTSGKTTNLTASWDLSVNETVWSPDSRSIYINADQQGRVSIFKIDVADAAITELVHDHVNSTLIPSADGKLYFKQQSVTQPDELYCLDPAGKTTKQLTRVNQAVLDQLAMQPAEDFTFTSFDGKKAHGLLIKPPFFDPAKKYPMVYVIHGGPQGMSEDNFHFRWNPSLFAAPGYVVAMVNFRGSTGYGQAWTDAVSKDWGGGPYKDLMAGVDYLVKTIPFIDSERIAAAGGSYGGFMINWIATHTDRFKALISHAGVFDQRSMYGATEELWFAEWEMGGTPYDHPEAYAKWSPSFYIQNLKKFKTPTLVIHGENDYRVPYTQGLQMFTALQKMGVPSRLLVYPDETHFVLKPQNSRLWWSEVHGWLARWLK
jgi:dipeptidyl aminopeptidase/acylaminoacyl peptidase